MKDGDAIIALSLVGISVVLIIVASTMLRHPVQLTTPFRDPMQASPASTKTP
jgi:hypothetical protein